MRKQGCNTGIRNGRQEENKKGKKKGRKEGRKESRTARRKRKEGIQKDGNTGGKINWTNIVTGRIFLQLQCINLAN